jgi:hypothetical protein
MTTDHLPPAWPVVDRALFATAKDTALRALATAPLAHYYDIRGGYAGATFAAVAPNAPYDVTGADLHALSMLSVRVGPAATRRVLDYGEPRQQLLEALAGVDPSVRLEDADAKQLAAAWNLHEAAKCALADPTKRQSDPWVTAAKLAARKRPRLLPVRDNKVRALLGLASARDGRLEIQVLRFLIGDPDVSAAISESVTKARRQAQADGRECVFDVEPLRILDAALWLHSLQPGGPPSVRPV